MRILFTFLLLVLTTLPAHAGRWVLKEYEVQSRSRGEMHEVYSNSPEQMTVQGAHNPLDEFGPTTSGSISYTLPAYQNGYGNSVSSTAILNYFGSNAVGKAGRANCALTVTPVFEWIGDGTPDDTIFYKEYSGAELFRSHLSYNFGAGGGDYQFDDQGGGYTYEGGHFTYEYSTSWDDELSNWDHVFPHSGVSRDAWRRSDGNRKWRVAKISAEGHTARGETRNLSLSVEARSVTLGGAYYNYSPSVNAQLRVDYQVDLTHFSIDVSTSEIGRNVNKVREKDVDAHASKVWTGVDNPGSPIGSHWKGTSSFSAHISPELIRDIGKPEYHWNDGASWSQSDVDNVGSVFSKEFTSGADDLDGSENTSVRLMVRGADAGTGILTAKATVNWYAQPYTKYRAEIETEVIDYNTGETTKLSDVMGGGNPLETEEERALDEFTTDYEAMKTEFVQTGSQLVGSALEAEMMVGSWFVPDEVDVATAGLTLAGKPLKKLYKVGRTLKASAEAIQRVNRVRDKLAGAVPAIRKKLGHGNFAIVMKRKKFREGRFGHVGSDGKRVEAKMGEVKEEEETLCNIPGGACFVKGTLVATQNGLRAIETLKKNELVWSRDEQTGETQLKPIAQTFERYSTTLALTFDNGETIETTSEHPFYVVGRGFVKAGELGIGTSIVTRAGPSLALRAATAGKAQTVYNFEVADYHTYFVGSGEVWVHNNDCGNYPNDWASNRTVNTSSFYDTEGEARALCRRMVEKARRPD